jgi:BirA family transcriptional regulator, biotin operon repressor / biotin---[acetyl-CoA-carboxylase] ligase
MQLDPIAAAAGVKLIAHETIGSTSTAAMALARRGERGLIWIAAARQTAGRGRRGNAWSSEAGNLYVSLLLGDGVPAQRAGELSFVAALAVLDAIVALAPRLALRLAVKWPNDLLLDGAKLSGILIEAEGSAVVVGIGVNCAHHPADTSFPATDLAAGGAAITPQQLFRYLSKTMLARLQQWGRGVGFASIRADWLARATGLGQDIRVRLSTQELVGRFHAIDETGRLMLRLADGSLRPIAAGEVFAIAGPDRLLSVL